MEEKKEKKRKGYKTSRQQVEANKRYLAKNPEKKEKNKISVYKSSCKKFIKEFANLEDIKEVESLIILRKKILKKDEKN